MRKRKPLPSINIGDKNLNKKLKFSKQDPDQQQQQPIRKFKSRREKEIHQMIDKIKSERKFIYKNAERHVKLGLLYSSLASSLPAVLKDLQSALKKLDEHESSLIDELESLKLPVRNTRATPLLSTPISHVNTSSAITDATSVNNNSDNTITTTTTTTTTTTDTATTINNNYNFASTTNTLPVNSVTRTTATLLEVNSLITATLRPTTSTTTATIGTSATTDDTTDTSIDSTNTIVTTNTTTTETTMKKKGRPPLSKEIPENCYVCRVTETPYWRRGTDEGEIVDLCNACGLHYMKLEKKERLSKEKNSTTPSIAHFHQSEILALKENQITYQKIEFI
ncbi:hypothetical protein ACTFIY_010524 [Dictyostelium cf. discoideum]